MAAANDARRSTGSSRRPRRGARSDSAARTAAPRRSSRSRPAAEALITDLSDMVDRLIKENRDLKRALTRAERGQAGGNLGRAARTLTGLRQRLSRALADSATSRRGAAAAPTAPRPRRKVTDPEVLERRRQALVKARAARQAKREAAGR